MQAEGVEHEAEAAGLRAVNCDLAQGYYFHRPMTSGYIDVLLREAAAPRLEGPIGTVDARDGITT